MNIIYLFFFNDKNKKDELTLQETGQQNNLK